MRTTKFKVLFTTPYKKIAGGSRYLMAAVLGLGALLTSTGALHAGKLYVPNFSFESQVTPLAGPDVDSWQKPPQPAGFDPGTFGEWTNLAGVFLNPPPTNSDFIDNADGSQLAFLFAYPQMALFQDFNSTDWSNGPPTHAFNALFEPGKSYTLTVGVTSSSEEPLTQGSTLLMSLYYRDSSNNMVTVAATTVTYDTNVFTNITHLLDFQATIPVVRATDPWAGQHIGIQFESTVSPELLGGVWDLDNVRLTEEIFVPNFSFESQVTPFASAEVDSWQKPAQPAGFDPGTFGDWTNLAGVFLNAPPTNADFIDNADGSQLGLLFAYPQMALFQDFNSTDWSNGPPTHAFNAVFEPGKSYTLTVGLTSSREEPLTQGSTLLMSLYYRDSSNNMVTVAATTVTYDTNVFTNITHLLDFQATIPVVRATDPWAGQHIGIQFESTVSPELLGGVWDLDNVRLTEIVATLMNSPGLANGQFGFTLQSEPGLPFEIQAATSPNQPGTNWTSIAAFTNVTGAISFIDPATNIVQRFYRAHQLQ